MMQFISYVSQVATTTLLRNCVAPRNHLGIFYVWLTRTLCRGCSNGASYERPDLYRANSRILHPLDCIRELLRTSEIAMHPQVVLVLIVSAVTAIYLFYALLRPEKF